MVWAAAALALTVSLAAQSMGFASGFGPATFRAVQLSGLLLAPLWLAWGLAELTWPGKAARFGARLACGALTVVGSVILATDLLAPAPFGKDWPLAGAHYQQPSRYALDAVQGVAVILALASLGVTAAQAGNGQQRRRAMPGTAAAALAVAATVAMRFPLPGRSAYPLLSLAAAALAWFGASRLEARPDRSGSRPRRRPRRPPTPGPGSWADLASRITARAAARPTVIAARQLPAAAGAGRAAQRRPARRRGRTAGY